MTILDLGFGPDHQQPFTRTTQQPCSECGHRTGTDRDELRWLVGTAPLRFRSLLAPWDDARRRARPPNGWSSLEHLVHVSEVFDVARRELFWVCLGGEPQPAPRIEAPRAGDNLVEVDDALAQLRAATRWLLGADEALRLRTPHDELSVQVLDGVAHEADHHLRLAGEPEAAGCWSSPRLGGPPSPLP